MRQAVHSTAEATDAGPIMAARALQPWLADQAMRIEDNNAMLPDVAERLVEADLFRMSVPKRFGGLEMHPSKACRAIYEVAKGCGSSAWLVSLSYANVFIVGKFSARAQSDVFDCGKPSILSFLTGGVAVGVNAQRTEGGIILSGEWRYASGIDVASWVGLLVNIPTEADGGETPTIILVPQEEFEIDHSSWNVMGMRGTGSKNVSLENVFIPEHRFMDWARLQAGEVHADCPNEDLLYRYPLNSVFAMSIAAPTLGVAASVGDTYCRTVKTRVNSGTKVAQIGDKASQVQVAAMQALMDLLCEGLASDMAHMSMLCENGRRMSNEERALIRMRMATSSRIALQEAQKIFRSVGGSLLPKGTPLERQFRDLHAMSSHFLLSEDAIGEAYGCLLLGLDLPAGARI